MCLEPMAPGFASSQSEGDFSRAGITEVVQVAERFLEILEERGEIPMALATAARQHAVRDLSRPGATAVPRMLGYGD